MGLKSYIAQSVQCFPGFDPQIWKKKKRKSKEFHEYKKIKYEIKEDCLKHACK